MPDAGCRMPDAGCRMPGRSSSASMPRHTTRRLAMCRAGFDEARAAFSDTAAPVLSRRTQARHRRTLAALSGVVDDARGHRARGTPRPTTGLFAVASRLGLKTVSRLHHARHLRARADSRGSRSAFAVHARRSARRPAAPTLRRATVHRDLTTYRRLQTSLAAAPVATKMRRRRHEVHHERREMGRWRVWADLIHTLTDSPPTWSWSGLRRGHRGHAR
jgi:hypothetical protein